MRRATSYTSSGLCPQTFHLGAQVKFPSPSPPRGAERGGGIGWNPAYAYACAYACAHAEAYAYACAHACAHASAKGFQVCVRRDEEG